jgi:hypothetical protein
MKIFVQSTVLLGLERLTAKLPPFSTRVRILLRPRFVLCVAILLCLFDVLTLVHTLRPTPYAIANADFGAFLRAAHLLRDGKNPYDAMYWKPVYWYGTASVHDQYPYPPFFAEVIAGLSFFGDTFAYYLWILLSLVALAGTGVLLLRHFGTRVPWHWVLLSVGVILSSSVARNELYHAQTNYVLLAMITLGIWLYGRGRARASGIIWGLAIAVKPFLVVLLIYLLWKRSWRAAISCIATGAIVTALSFLPTLGNGWEVVHGYIETSAYYAGVPFSARPDNHAVHAFLLRIFSSNPYTIPWVESPPLLTLTTILLAITVLVAFYAGISPRSTATNPASATGSTTKSLTSRPNAQLLVEVGAAMALSMAYGPFTEGDHLYLLVPGLAGIIMLTYQRFAVHHATSRWWLASSILWSLVLIRLALPISILIGEATGATWAPVGGLRLLWTGQIGFLLLAAALVLAETLRRERTDLRYQVEAWRSIIKPWVAR